MRLLSPPEDKIPNALKASITRRYSRVLSAIFAIGLFIVTILEGTMPMIGSYKYEFDDFALHIKPRIFGIIPWRRLTVPYSRIKRVRRVNRLGAFNVPFVTWGNLYYSLLDRGVAVDLKTWIPVSLYIAPTDSELSLLRQIATTQGIDRGPGI